jgi:hypothetical protein
MLKSNVPFGTPALRRAKQEMFLVRHRLIVRKYYGCEAFLVTNQRVSFDSCLRRQLHFVAIALEVVKVNASLIDLSAV